jgi:FKBP-type peptidyl-prolyl cis-trans isomerase
MRIVASALVFFVVAGLVGCGEESVRTTESGMRYEVLKEGKPGTEPQEGDTVAVHYRGELENGVVFDTSAIRKEPFRFRVGMREVIDGWDEIVRLMTVGSKIKVHIPAKLAYGSQARDTIPANSNLIFTMELVEVKPGKRPPKPPPADPAKTKTTKSGWPYEEITEGEGSPPSRDVAVKVRFAAWSADGRFIADSDGAGVWANTIDNLAQQAPFLPEALTVMRPGGTYRFEIPNSALAPAWAPMFPPEASSIWTLTLESVMKLPEYERPDPANLKTTPSGLRYEVIKEGTGARPTRADTVTVHYSGWLEDGKLFDSSSLRGQPATFQVGGVIPGWTEGLQLMKVGSIYRFVIPPSIAYAMRPPPGSGIPQNATLVFRVELLEVT